MPNDPNGATAEGMSAADRTAQVDALLTDLIALQRHDGELGQRFSAAQALLPDWAKPGPQFMDSRGVFCGGTVGWPMAAVLPQPPAHSAAYAMVRPSIHETWESRTRMIPPKGGRFPELRRKQRLAAFAHIRRIIARIREQRAAREAVGLFAIEADMEANCARIYAIEDKLTAPATGIDPVSLAVKALFAYRYDQSEFAMEILRRTAPLLPGLLRIVVDDMIENGQDDPERTILCGAGVAPGVSPCASAGRVAA